MREIVGLYLHPPDRALVLWVDEKSQIQDLGRTQPILPMMPGMPERRTHDYGRHGTTTLFAVLNIAIGKVIGELHRRHRSQEWLQSLRTNEEAAPKKLEVHLVMEHYGTTETSTAKRWLARNSRFHVHFTPTSASCSIRSSARSLCSPSATSAAALIAVPLSWNGPSGTTSP